MRKKLHYDWHWIWDYGNGDLGNQGIHEMDKARWGLGKNELAEVGRQRRRPLRLRRRRRDGQHADLRLRLRRLRADLRGARLAVEIALPRQEEPQGQHQADQLCRQHLLRQRRLPGLPQLHQRRRLTPTTARSSRSSAAATITSATSSRPSAAARSRTSTPTSSKAICPAPCATWATSAIASATSSRSARRPKAFGDDKEAGDTFERMEEHLKDNKIALDEHPVPRRPQADARPEEGDLRRRQGRQRHADARVPQGLRGAGEGLRICRSRARSAAE